MPPKVTIPMDPAIIRSDAAEQRRREADRQRDLAESLRQVLQHLEDNDREIIQRYFGIDRPKETQQQLGRALGVSQSAVAQRIQRILRDLRKFKGQIRAFYEPYF